MSYTSLFYHIVFSTKDRRPFLAREQLTRTAEYIGGIVRNEDAQMLAGDGAEDHLHLVVAAGPSHALADVVRTIKANSSKWVHDTFNDLGTFAWQDGYSAFTVSRSVLPRAIGYIRSQAEHHKKMGFQEELILLLKKHGVRYDERYI